MEIKIVGSITEDGQIEEIESIAKIFAYEQRMKCFHKPIHYIPTPLKSSNPQKQPNIEYKQKTKTSTNLFVHGLL